jgi:ribosome-binding protein aMBF1 (putative translation factor)
MISKRPVTKKPKRSAAELARLKAIREKFQRERPSLRELVASGDYTEPVPQPEYLLMLELAAELKRTRQARRLSLADVAKRSGIDKAALSRIENGQNANPTIGTLQTIARSLGVRLRFQLDAGR